MLTRLQISNIALIDKSDIAFDAGFSALTGETGAGKSILIESVSFVLGDRASRDSIRTGANKATVEAEFLLTAESPAYRYLCDHTLDDGMGLTLYRELSVSGRNVCRANGVLVSTAELKTLGDLLVDLHGQHAHQSLLNSDTHLALIDAYAGSDRDGLLSRTQAERQRALQLQNEWKILEAHVHERARRIDALQYQLQEIDGAQLTEGEEEQLTTERERMRHAETIRDNLEAAYDALFADGGVLEKLTDARTSLGGIGRFDPAYQDMASHADDAYYTIEDVAYGLRDARDGFSYDPNRLEEIESRLAAIQRLERKYGATIAEILSYRARIFEEVSILNDGDNQVDQKKQAFQEATARFGTLAQSLSARRKQGAQALCRDTLAHLKDMGMAGAQFETVFTDIPYTALSETGVDTAEFYLSANRGEPQKPLAKIASGGEVSRIMLAMKVALADADHIDTLIFDEIDTGISGMVANAVAKKMRALSKRHQVLCVTHLPQIAAHADVQYVAYKFTEADKTHSVTRRLAPSERAAELARIMGSDATDATAMEHAARLLSQAQTE